MMLRWILVMPLITSAMYLFVLDNETGSLSGTTLVSPELYEGPLPFSLTLTEAELETLYSTELSNLDDCQTCLQVNSTICHCFDVPLSNVEIRIPPVCVRSEFYWLSVSLHNCKHRTSGLHFQSVGIRTQSSLSNHDLKSSRTVDDPRPLPSHDAITLLLPLTLDDLSRSLLLLESLRITSLATADTDSSSLIYEMIVVVPDVEHRLVAAALFTPSQSLPFPVSVIPESTVIPPYVPSLRPQLTADLQPYFPASGSRFDWYSLPHATGYAIQMGIKLLAAQLIKTDFYITLDADVISMLPLTHSSLFSSGCLCPSSCGLAQTSSPSCCTQDEGSSLSPSNGRAVFQDESRDIHPDWWLKSSNFLYGDIVNNTNTNTNASGEDNLAALLAGGGFGVTPAVLSTFGSLVALKKIREAVSRILLHSMLTNGLCEGNLECLASSCSCELYSVAERAVGSLSTQILHTLWLQMFYFAGAVWSEYTIYRLALDQELLFDSLHVSEENLIRLLDLHSCPVDPSKAACMFEVFRLHCDDVWYADQLPWMPRRTPARPAALTEESDCQIAQSITADTGTAMERCLFSVVQSTTKVSPRKLLSIL